MKPYLLDVNVLVALTWPTHVHHRRCETWYSRNRAAGFRTTPLTELGLVRVVSNPSFSVEALTPSGALELLERVTSLPEHGFWPQDLDVFAALKGIVLSGHHQFSDAYLIALARKHGGRVATLDRALLALGTTDDVELVR